MKNTKNKEIETSCGMRASIPQICALQHPHVNSSPCGKQEGRTIALYHPEHNKTIALKINYETALLCLCHTGLPHETIYRTRCK